MRASTENLHADWHWRRYGAECARIADLSIRPLLSDEATWNIGWTKARHFPSEIHVELKEAGLIADPYVGFNEHSVQWVAEAEWLYRCTFSVESTDDGMHRAANVFRTLQFDGLDTFCDVYLNGANILETDNMFRTYLTPIPAELLEASATQGAHETSNTLLLHFKSAKIIAKDLEKTHGKVRAGSVNLGDPSRVYVRKAQYDWRWDWGPELMTCGPYRPIKLITYRVRLSSVHPRALVSQDLSRRFKLDAVLSGDISTAEGCKIRCILRQSTVGAPDQSQSSPIRDEVHEIQLSAPEEVSGSSEVEIKDIIDWDLGKEVQLWWPVGYGLQALYDAEITLLSADGDILDRVVHRVGFRRTCLIEEPLQEPDQYGTGTTFLFEVNGVRMFMGGSNWIPADNFLTTVTPDRYRRWLTLLKEGNQNMVRLWGGGVYEPDVFYDICDELGILVWQDFQFACGVYPAHQGFVDSVRAEAEDNVKRLRHHPSLALFCGNNEDYQQVLQWGDVEDLPARILYEDILPDVVKKHTDPPIPYHRGSPYGGKGWDTADPTVGDVHQWDIWGGKERSWQDYVRMGGRFVSEFGIPAMPDIRTIDYWLDGNKRERWAQSKLMQQHNRAGAHERRFAIVMNENFRLTGDFETHVFNTQIMQSEAVSLAYRMWRREWRGPGKEYCAGALVWQLNDCWPVTSWALADYFLRPKPAFYTIARELRSITVGIFRTVIKNRPDDRPLQFYEFGAFQSIGATLEVWGTNSTLAPISVTLEMSYFDLESDWTHRTSQSVVLLPNQATELLAPFACFCPPTGSSQPHLSTLTTSYSVVAQARLVDPATSAVLARYADWPQPYRFLDCPDPELRVEVEDEHVTVTVAKPVKALVLSVTDGDEEVRWSDNALDVVPGDSQVVVARGLAGRRIKAAYLGRERAAYVF